MTGTNDRTDLSTALPFAIQDVIAAWSQPASSAFEQIRQIVFGVALRNDIGALDESLKWGQPAWRPTTARIGSTLRCSWSPDRPDDLSLYVNCNTTLADTIRDIYPDEFSYEGRRGLHMALSPPLPTDAIDHCAQLTLTYHRKAP